MFIAILLVTINLNNYFMSMPIAAVPQFASEVECNSFLQSPKATTWVKEMVQEFTVKGNNIVSIDKTFCTSAKDDKV